MTQVWEGWSDKALEQFKASSDTDRVGSLSVLPVDAVHSNVADCWYEFRLYDVETILNDGTLVNFDHAHTDWRHISDDHFAVYEVIYCKEKMNIALRPCDIPLGDLMTRQCGEYNFKLYRVPYFMKKHVRYNECKALVM